MTDPVVAQDGITYQREALEQYINYRTQSKRGREGGHAAAAGDDVVVMVMCR